MAACYSELQSRIGKEESLYKQLDIYEILVNLYPKKMYFIQLGGIYGQLNRELDYMITLNAAYQKDLLDKESEYLALTQLLLLNNNPYFLHSLTLYNLTGPILNLLIPIIMIIIPFFLIKLSNKNISLK